MSEDLISEERILTTRKPHILSFWPYYLYFLWYICGSGILLWRLGELEAWIGSSFIGTFFGSVGVTVMFMLIWWGLMILPALIFSILQIEWKWVIGFVILSSIGTYLFHMLAIGESMLLYATIGVGVIGLLLSDIYRRSHRYYLTTFRILTKLGFLGSTTRQIPYSQITDLITESGFLGGVFNYSSVIPLTSSGMGTGEEEAKVEVGAGGGASQDLKAGRIGMGGGLSVTGGRSVTVPRSRSYFVLYGIPNPDEVRGMITEKMREKEAAHQIDKQTKILGKKLDELIEERDKRREDKK